MTRGMLIGGVSLFVAGVIIGLAGAGWLGTRERRSVPETASVRPAYFRAIQFPEVGEQLRVKANQYIGAAQWFPHNVLQWNDRVFIDVRQPAIGLPEKLIQWVAVFRWDGIRWELEEFFQADPG